MYNYIKHKYIFLILVLFHTLAFSQYRTQALVENIKTVQVIPMGNGDFSSPVIELSSNIEFLISFDELSHDIHNYYYDVIHCNADWTPSDISPLVWADGFTNNLTIDDIKISQNTTYNYTHYAIVLPNEDLQFRASGNYTISVYEDNNPDKKVATACFSIVDNRVMVDANVRGNTDIDINGKMQQLDFSIIPGNFHIDNPMSELKIIVQQNGRFDNMVSNISPTYTSGGKLSYINNKALIFEGGNEYHPIDISSIYAYGDGVNKMRFFAPYYHAELFPNTIAPYAPYVFYQEVNGRYIVNIQEYENDETWSDYILTHFTLPTDKPFFDGQIYLLSGFNYNQINSAVRMNYNNKLQAYEQTVLLKQGGYNYLYGFAQKGKNKLSTQRIEGSHWQTENEYAIYVYHRGFGERYDKLIAVKIIQSGQ